MMIHFGLESIADTLTADWLLNVYSKELFDDKVWKKNQGQGVIYCKVGGNLTN